MNREQNEQEVFGPGDLGGRPCKIEPFITAMRAILGGLEKDESIIRGGSTFIYTDEELFELVNASLNPDERICLSTFDKWKSRAHEFKKNGAHHPLFDEFLQLIKIARLKQKGALFEKMSSDGRNWTRWAWSLERKYPELRAPKILDKEESSKIDDDEEEIQRITVYKIPSNGKEPQNN